MSVHDSNDWSEALFSRIIESIQSENPITIVRYGDGELTCVMYAKKGGGGFNYDGDLYDANLGAMIKDTILNPIAESNFVYALGEHCRHVGFVSTLERDKLWNPNIKWEDAFVFVHAGIDGRLQSLIDLINEQHSIFVAPEYLHGIKVDFDTYVTTTEHRSFTAKDEIERKVEEQLSQDSPSIVICALGMSAIPIIHSLYRKFGNSHTFIDIGSVFDPYVSDGKYRSHFDKIQKKLDL